jgi:hypothetical protein
VAKTEIWFRVGFFLGGETRAKTETLFYLAGYLILTVAWYDFFCVGEIGNVTPVTLIMNNWRLCIMCVSEYLENRLCIMSVWYSLCSKKFEEYAVQKCSIETRRIGIQYMVYVSLLYSTRIQRQFSPGAEPGYVRYKTFFHVPKNNEEESNLTLITWFPHRSCYIVGCT